MKSNINHIAIGDTVTVIDNIITHETNNKGRTGQVIGFSSLFSDLIYVKLSGGYECMFDISELYKIHLL